ncbi:hypothetical protein HPB47_002972 [Ixodes persulcatus]|uniref:Uncharacterized protein n=1 Tax=Ixodes persulcatus TaxID=34615 RepID=A0AC60PJQ8_IXOPE|nr:hypothetical protein HPB47_002972 [Ixodes persulcatus]
MSRWSVPITDKERIEYLLQGIRDDQIATSIAVLPTPNSERLPQHRVQSGRNDRPFPSGPHTHIPKASPGRTFLFYPPHTTAEPLQTKHEPDEDAPLLSELNNAACCQEPTNSKESAITIRPRPRCLLGQQRARLYSALKKCIALMHH